MAMAAMPRGTSVPVVTAVTRSYGQRWSAPGAQVSVVVGVGRTLGEYQRRRAEQADLVRPPAGPLAAWPLKTKLCNRGWVGMNRALDRLSRLVVVVLCVRVTCTLAENNVAGAPLQGSEESRVENRPRFRTVRTIQSL
jgi:hypothetical protein